MAYKDTVRGGGKGPDGVNVLQTSSSKSYWAAGWKGINEFRPYACPDGQGGVSPARMSTTPNDFSDFIIAAETVVYTGQHRKLTFISEWKGMSDAEESPAMRLHRTIHKAWESGAFPQWKPFVYGRNAFIQKPGISVFMQGKLIKHNGKKVDRDDVVFMVKQSGRWALEKLLSEQNPDYQHPGDESAIDLAKYFKYPDPTAPNGGCLVVEPKEATQERNAHYAVGLGTSLPVDVKAMIGAWTPWDQTLKYMTAEEQIQLFMTAYSPEILAYAFQGTPWLTDEIKACYPQQGNVGYQPGQYAGQQQPVGQPPVGGYGQPPQQPPMQQPAQQPVQQPVQQPAGQPGFAQPQTMPQGGQPADPTQPPAFAQPGTPPQAQAGMPGYPAPGTPGAQPSADPNLSFAASEATGQPPAQQQAAPTFMQEAAAGQPSAVPPEAAEAQKKLDAMNTEFTQPQQQPQG